MTTTRTKDNSPMLFGLTGQTRALHGLPEPQRTTFDAPPRVQTAVVYLRVSTDDKGQDPERQLMTIRPWAQREGVTISRVFVDEGTSATKTDPFSRPKFVEACEYGFNTGASAVLVETIDRFSRQGVLQTAWCEVEVERRYRLKVWKADLTLSDHDNFGGDIMTAAKAGWARVSALLNAERGAHMLTDARARRERSISSSALQRLYCKDSRCAVRGGKDKRGRGFTPQIEYGPGPAAPRLEHGLLDTTPSLGQAAQEDEQPNQTADLWAAWAEREGVSSGGDS